MPLAATLYWTLKAAVLRITQRRLRHQISALFDSEYYLSRYPDVAASGTDPLTHFIVAGVKEGRNPNSLFQTAYYLERNPEVAEAGINPLLHFLTVGARKGRRPNPLFDPAYYLEQNPDVAASGVNPLVHFLGPGAWEGRKPNPLFDTAYYLAQNPELRRGSDLQGSQEHGILAPSRRLPDAASAPE